VPNPWRIDAAGAKELSPLATSGVDTVFRRSEINLARNAYKTN
jgi:hypothetical protein